MILLSKRAVVLGLLVSASPAFAQDAPPFAVGQTWTIRGLEKGRATIGRIEAYGDTLALHISITADTPARFNMPPGHRTSIAHTPIEQEAFMRSVLLLEATGAAPAAQFEEGYSQWKAASDSGNAGIFSIDVSGIVDVMSEMMARSGFR